MCSVIDPTSSMPSSLFLIVIGDVTGVARANVSSGGGLSRRGGRTY